MRQLYSRHLEHFLAVYQARSLRQAAETCGVTQPALTKSLRLLESALSVSLFERHATGVAPTQAGEILRRYAQHIVNSGRYLEMEIGLLRGGGMGTLRVGSGIVWSVTRIPRLLARLHARYPDLEISLQTGIAEHLTPRLIATAIYRELRLAQFYELFVAAAKTTGVVMFLVAAAMVSAWLITIADLPTMMIKLLEPLIDSPMLLMFVIMGLVIAVGTAMDMTPTILILTPVLMPVVKAAGIDPVYFGVLFIINNSIGLVTPPVGTVLNVVAGVGRMSMDDVTRGVLPFAIAQFAMLLLMVLFPYIVIWPARLLAGG